MVNLSYHLIVDLSVLEQDLPLFLIVVSDFVDLHEVNILVKRESYCILHLLCHVLEDDLSLVLIVLDLVHVSLLVV